MLCRDGEPSKWDKIEGTEFICSLFIKAGFFFFPCLFCIVLFQIKTLTHMTFLGHFGYTWRHTDGAGAAMECRAAQPGFARQPTRVLVASSSMGISDREVLDYLSSSLEMLCSLH